ncbi:MAG: CARDB domain-containing protein [Ferruginibacter sp.]
MQKILKLLLLLFFTVILLQATAQTPQVPKGTPGKVPLPSPKLQPLKPDLQFVSARVVSVTEVASRHIFEVKLLITYKNAGAVATGTGFYLDLQSQYGTTSGGTDYSIIGSRANLHPLAAGQTRSEVWVFAKDITALGRGTHRCIVRIDCTNRIAESNEDNNNSDLFNIVIPR